jgi:hypothetical protein
MSFDALQNDIVLYTSNFIEKDCDVVRFSSTCRRYRGLLIKFLTQNPQRMQRIVRLCIYKPLPMKEAFLNECKSSQYKEHRFEIWMPTELISEAQKLQKILPNMIIKDKTHSVRTLELAAHDHEMAARIVGQQLPFGPATIILMGVMQTSALNLRLSAQAIKRK